MSKEEVYYSFGGVSIPAIGMGDDLPTITYLTTHKVVEPRIFINCSSIKKFDVLDVIPDGYGAVYLQSPDEEQINYFIRKAAALYIEKDGLAKIHEGSMELHTHILTLKISDCLERVGVAVRQAKNINGHISIRIEGNNTIFYTIAMCRALRHILKPKWQNNELSFELMYGCGWDAQPHEMLIKLSVFYFIGVCCGADRIILPPLQENVDDPNSLRLVFNIGIIAREETDMLSYYDPAYGSYFIENLTHAIIKKLNDTGD